MVNSSKRILFIGAGQIASSIATQLSCAGFTCFGYSRSPRLQERHIRWVSSSNVLKLEAIQTVVFTLTPSDRSPDSYQRDYFRSLDQWLSTPPVRTADQIIWISSTRIYGQDTGELITSQTMPQPRDIQGQILLNCEHRVATERPQSSLVIRFPGLYGTIKGFMRLTHKLKRHPFAQQWPPRWQNRLHRTDASQLIAHCIQHEVKGIDPLLACDLKPSTEWETASWLADHLGIQLANQTEQHKRGKRVQSNLVNLTGYRLETPHWKAGYKSLLKQLEIRSTV